MEFASAPERSSGATLIPEGEQWFCVRSQPRRELVAERFLATLASVETFLPKVRFRRPVRGGVAWVTEAMFPGYLFARFDCRLQLRAVCHAHGVVGVVHFRNEWPIVPQETIGALRAAVGEDLVRVIEAPFEPADEVEIGAGPLRGIAAVVERALPASRRVLVLMEFLGQQTRVEIPEDYIEASTVPRLRTLSRPVV